MLKFLIFFSFWKIPEFFTILMGLTRGPLFLYRVNYNDTKQKTHSDFSDHRSILLLKPPLAPWVGSFETGLSGLPCNMPPEPHKAPGISGIQSLSPAAHDPGQLHSLAGT